MKCMQLVKYLIIDESIDNFANYIAQRSRDKSNQETGRIWRPCRVADKIKSDLEWESKYQSKPSHIFRRDNQICNTPDIFSCTPKEKRKLSDLKTHWKVLFQQRWEVVISKNGKAPDHNIRISKSVTELTEAYLT